MYLAEIDRMAKLPFSLIIFLNSLGHNGEYEFLKLHSCDLQARENTKIPTFDIKLTQWKSENINSQRSTWDVTFFVPYTCLVGF